MGTYGRLYFFYVKVYGCVKNVMMINSGFFRPTRKRAPNVRHLDLCFFEVRFVRYPIFRAPLAFTGRLAHSDVE